MPWRMDNWLIQSYIAWLITLSSKYITVVKRKMLFFAGGTIHTNKRDYWPFPVTVKKTKHLHFSLFYKNSTKTTAADDVNKCATE